MLRRLSSTAAILFLLYVVSAPGPALGQGIGLSVGANFNELSDIDSGDHQATFDNASGWHIHLWFDLPVGPAAIRPGVRYMDAGQLFDDEGTLIGPDPNREEQTVTLLEIPIDVRIRMPLPLITPYVLAGPVLRFPANPSEDEDRLRSFSFAGGAGIGAELGLAGLQLYPELKYTFGITRFTEEEYEIGGVIVRPDEDQRLNAIMLSLGIGL